MNEYIYIYKNILFISKSKFFVKILFGDIKSEFIKMLLTFLRLKVDGFCHYYFHVN